jgi:exopolysaccharide biosynthesis polyprenyl glycosylphosphotransferase
LLRRHSAALRMSLMAADAVSAWALFLLVSMFRFGPDWHQQWDAIGVDPHLLAGLYAVAWTSILWLLGLYRMRVRWSWRREWVDILRGVVLLAVGSLAVLFAVKLPDVSRIFLGQLFLAQAVVTIASRFVVRRLYALAHSRGYNASFVLVVGDGPHARAFARRLGTNPAFGIRVVGFLRDPEVEAVLRGTTVSPADAEQPPLPELADILASAEPRVLGTVDQLPAVLHAVVVDEVVICLPPEAVALVEPIARLCEDERKVVRIPLEPARISLAGGVEDSFDGVPVLSLVYGPDRTVALTLKRLVDVIGSLAALVLLSPVLAIVALAIVWRDGRPALYRQTRIGLHGRPFSVYKFRSMVKDADQRLRELEALNEIQGPAFKVTDDPRVTRVGRILRKTSLDELPQFWNVLRGEMSIVGPRPPLPAEVRDYDIWHRRRLAMKPGITGLWQVSARHEENFDQWVRLDIDYIDRWSLLLDLRIMLRTVPALLQGR